MVLDDAKVCVADGIKSYEDLRNRFAAGKLDSIFAPITQLVRPGDTVVVKPNLVREYHGTRRNEWEQIVTNPAVVECVVRTVIEALQGKGRVIVADAPQADANWKALMELTGLDNFAKSISQNTGILCTCIDLREETWKTLEDVVVHSRRQKGDPMGYIPIDLGKSSEFSGKKNLNFYGADYDTSETHRYHNAQNNIYVMSKTVLSADVFINVPKMKTHKLAGVTGCLKNAVGTCIVKNSLPHHTIGFPDEGGDQFASANHNKKREGQFRQLALRLMRKKNPLVAYPLAYAKKILKLRFGSSSKTIRSGSWYGNDTIWRSVLDLNKILLYADKNGMMKNEPQRRYWAVLDGIVAGEGEGPLSPDAKSAGILISAGNPVAADAVQATLMGFDLDCLPVVKNAFDTKGWKLTHFDRDKVSVSSNNATYDGMLATLNLNDMLQFRPHFGWAGYVETQERLA